jgi:hypothetical protein
MAKSIARNLADVASPTGVLDGTLSTAAQTNITSLGTLTSLTVDDITIDGSTLTDAGDFTLDVGGDIILDAGGAQIRFHDDGTDIGVFSNESGNFIIKPQVSDADLIIKGNDGGSTITALTLDMSAAGAATFNAGVTATTFTGTLATAAQTNITSVGTLSSLTVGGNLLPSSDSAHNIGANATRFANAYFDTMYGTVGTAAQTNITSVGTLSALTVSGAVATGGNLSVTGQGDFSTQVLVGNNNSHFSENNIRFKSSGHAYIDHNTVGQDFIFRTSNSSSMDTTALVIQDNGNVGIGETNPDNALHITGSGFNAAHIKVERTDVGSSNDAALVLKAAAGANADYGLGGIWFQNALDTNAYALIRARTDDSSGTSGRLDFITSASSVGNTTAASMTIKSYGKVGIGETEPLGKLHIREGDSGQGSVNSNFDQLVLEDDAHSGMTILSGTSSDGGIYFGDSGGNNLGQFKYRHSDNSFRFIVNNGSDSLVIESNGMKMSNNTGTSTKLELINVDTEDGDTGRESTLRFSGFRSGGESVDNAQISGHHFGTADDDKGGIIFWTNTGSGLTEKMRIREDGIILIGKTSTSFGTEGVRIDPNNIQITRLNNTTVYLNRLSSDGQLLSFNRQGTERGSIGITTTSVQYYTTSDARLKDNIVDAPSASDDIDNIQVRSFDWKEDGSYQKYGMIAQELLPIAPEAVSQPEDSEEMMSIDYSKLVPMLVKEIQSLSARIRKLEEEK